MRLWELCWRWGWTSRVSRDEMQVFSSWASWCLLLWRTEWGLRQPADAKCLLNFVKEVSLCFCVTWNHYLTSLFPPLPRLMLMFLPPAAVDQQVPVCWCVLCVMANVNRVIVKKLLLGWNRWHLPTTAKPAFQTYIPSSEHRTDPSSADALIPVSTRALGACGRGPVFEL